MGLSQAELARKVGVTRGAVWAWEADSSAPKRDTAQVVSRILNLPLAAILGDMTYSNVATIADLSLNCRNVPLIAWVDAGKGAQAVDAYPVGDGLDFVQVYFPVSEGTFALEVRGSSMEPRFTEGDTLVIDPAVAPKPDDFVICEVLADGADPGQGEVTFKQYRPRGTAPDGTPTYDLTPLNPQAATITVNKTNPGRLIGTVVEHRHRLRR
jgi:SOS-response transcriptional repressor LexA